MYDYYYNNIIVGYPGARMMYTDTDSFLFYIETEEFYKEIPLNKYDTCNYPEDSPFYSETNKKAIG